MKIMNEDKKIQNKNIFAVGFFNGGFWAGYSAGTAKVNSGVSYYGVWKANYGLEFTNPYPMKYFSESSSPILALHGDRDKLQRMEWVEQAWDQIRDNGAKLNTYIYPEAGMRGIGNI